jgi:phosphoserine aminotransferase
MSSHSLPHGRVHNFSAGPGALPLEVLEQAREEMFNFKGSGVSLMEMSHRSKPFESMLEQAIADLRELMSIPSNYKILFLQGGASGQFTMLSKNLRHGNKAEYIVTGDWGKKAVSAGKLEIGETKVVWDGKETNYNRAPVLAEITPSSHADYIHYTSNETIRGVSFFDVPPTDGTWVCDMSSDILSRPIDVSKFALIYAGAQKNMGPAGATVVIIRDDLIEKVPEGLPPTLDYRVAANNNSLYNTPPCWSIYVCGLVYAWLLKNGGLTAMETTNRKKAGLIYDVIDKSHMFNGHADPANRSLMNITFTLPSDHLTAEFQAGAKAHGMIELKGHRDVGGCRASIYNAVPLESCQALAEYMVEFESKNG